ncbi:MAG: NADH-quinone oxidoreductase subunit C [Holosporales bacterium]|jgi:NADH:ubiquinone oxidoreductase subunit C|nr:NADH-quinone oxidoreductase subunit C [Holosporales bacterium]
MSNDFGILLKARLGDGFIKSIEESGNAYIYVKHSSILMCMSALQSDTSLGFSTLVDCFAVKNFPEEKNVGISIYYQLVSYVSGRRLFIISDIAGEARAQSLSIIFWNADWFEREIFETFGTLFDGHPNMKPIFSE